jgi:hypothetical protein
MTAKKQKSHVECGEMIQVLAEYDKQVAATQYQSMHDPTNDLRPVLPDFGMPEGESCPEIRVG